MEFLASVHECSEGGSILRYRFHKNAMGSRVLIPHVQDPMYHLELDQDTGKISAVGLAPTFIRWEPAREEENRLIRED